MKLGITNIGRNMVRNIPVTHCNGQVLVNGEFEDFSACYVGNTDCKKATKYYRRLVDNDTVAINNCEHGLIRCEISLQELIEKYSKER